MIRRILAAVLIIWALGFLWFAIALPQPQAGGESDAVIVPTGGPGRIDRGLELIDEGKAKSLLVTGVDREVKPAEFAEEYEVDEARMECCVTLGFAAVDTRGNAAEAAQWIEDNDYSSIRLVTTDWHMRRAALELGRTLPDTVDVQWDAVASEPSWSNLFLEYHKLLASFVAGLFA